MSHVGASPRLWDWAPMIELLGVKAVRHLPLNSVLLLRLKIGPLPFNFDFLKTSLGTDCLTHQGRITKMRASPSICT